MDTIICMLIGLIFNDISFFLFSFLTTLLIGAIGASYCVHYYNYILDVLIIITIQEFGSLKDYALVCK